MTNIRVADWRNAPYIDEFTLYHLVDKQEASVRDYTKHLSGFISFCCERWHCNPHELDFSRCTIIHIGNKRIYGEIKRDVIADYVQNLTLNGQSAAIRVLGMYFGYLLDKGVIAKNPVRGLSVKQHREPVQGLTLHEIELLAHHLTTMEEPYRFAFIIQLSAGLRVSEVTSLRIQDLNRTNDTQWEITICREAMKGKKEWRLPLPDVTDVVGSLMNWREEHGIDSEFLVTNRRGLPLKPPTLNYRLRQSTACMNFSKSVTTHDLRRAYATLMNQYVENPDVLVHAMRHQSNNVDGQRTTRGYVRQPQHSNVERWVNILPVVQLADSLAAVWLKRSEKNEAP